MDEYVPSIEPTTPNEVLQEVERAFSDLKREQGEVLDELRRQLDGKKIEDVRRKLGLV